MHIHGHRILWTLGRAILNEGPECAMDAATTKGFDRLVCGRTDSSRTLRLARRLISLLQVLALAWSLCAGALSNFALAETEPKGPPKRALHTVWVGGKLRQFTVYLPNQANCLAASGAEEGSHLLPVVFAFHGVLMNGETMAQMTRLEQTGNRCGFIVVYPDGDGHGIFRTWNAGGRSGRLERVAEDDVAFFRCMVDEVQRQYPVDSKRIHATGFSNGAMLCYRLAAETSDLIASIGPVAGTLAVAVPSTARPVPAIHIHGTEDKIVPWNGPNKRTPKNLDFMSVPETISAWNKQLGGGEAAENGLAVDCETECCVDRIADGTRIEIDLYYRGGDSSERELVYQFVRVVGGGHAWPGGWNREWIVGRSSEELIANEVLWEFFKQHPQGY